MAHETRSAWRFGRRPRGLVTAAVLAVALGASACGTHPTYATGGSPEAACGQVVGGEDAVEIWSIPVPSADQPFRLVADEPFAHLIIRIAPGCDHGAEVTITPPGRLFIAFEAKAKDGRPAVISFGTGQPGRATVVVRVDGRESGSVVADVLPVTPPSTHQSSAQHRRRITNRSVTPDTKSTAAA